MKIVTAFSETTLLQRLSLTGPVQLTCKAAISNFKIKVKVLDLLEE